MLRTPAAPGYAAARSTSSHYARTPDHQIYAEELADDRRSGPTSTCACSTPSAATRPTHRRAASGWSPATATSDTWACGPAGLIELVAAVRRPRGCGVEYFKPSATAERQAEGTTRSPPGRGGGQHRATLLEQAEALGLRPEFGCRMGICFSCTSRKTEGTVRNV